MQPRPDSHPLRPRQRAVLHGARALMGAMAPVARVRRARAGLGVPETHRYGTRAAETLEILTPESPREAAPPPIVYIHGGGWIFGRKELYTADLAFLVDRGHTVYNLDYPLAPEHPFPVPLEALAQALAWIRSRDPNAHTVHLMGDSAGGNLVAMLGLLCADPKLFEALDPTLGELSLPAVRSVVSLYGVLDRLSWLEHGFPGAELMLQSYGGSGAFEPEVGPESALTPVDWSVSDRPPMLLAIGDADPLAESSRIAQRRLADDGKPLELVEYPGEQHGFFNMGWRPAARRLRADIARFLDAHDEA